MSKVSIIDDSARHPDDLNMRGIYIVQYNVSRALWFTAYDFVAQSLPTWCSHFLRLWLKFSSFLAFLRTLRCVLLPSIIQYALILLYSRCWSGFSKHGNLTLFCVSWEPPLGMLPTQNHCVVTTPKLRCSFIIYLYMCYSLNILCHHYLTAYHSKFLELTSNRTSKTIKQWPCPVR